MAQLRSLLISRTLWPSSTGSISGTLCSEEEQIIGMTYNGENIMWYILEEIEIESG